MVQIQHINIIFSKESAAKTMNENRTPTVIFKNFYKFRKSTSYSETLADTLLKKEKAKEKSRIEDQNQNLWKTIVQGILLLLPANKKIRQITCHYSNGPIQIKEQHPLHSCLITISSKKRYELINFYNKLSQEVTFFKQ